MRIARIASVALPFMVLAASNASAISPGCAVLSSTTTPFTWQGIRFSKGDLIVVTMPPDQQGQRMFVQGSFSADLRAGQTAVFRVASDGSYPFTVTSSVPLTPTISCSPGPEPPGPPPPPFQLSNNADTAIDNGAQTLLNFTEWVGSGVLASFDLGASTPGRPLSSLSRARRAMLAARTRVDELRREERELAEGMSEGKTSDTEQRLRAVRLSLRLARLSADIEQAASGPLRPEDGAAGPSTADRATIPSIRLGARELIEMCEEFDGVNAMESFLGRRWNVWLEGRVIGATDRLAQTQGLGFVASTGVDYKFRPWLTSGLGVGVESYETQLAGIGARIGSFGLSAMPYVGIRLHENVLVTAFAGLTSIAYNVNPAANVSAGFGALRGFVGASVTGVWTEHNWRLQPSLSGSYGSERQDAYIDSLGGSVTGQTVNYGRLSAGPEVGYAFRSVAGAWSVEPFVLAKANVSFSSSNAVALNGQSLPLRPNTIGSGTAGLGVNVRFPSGVGIRALGSYESIGVSGLDVWAGMLRGNLAF